MVRKGLPSVRVLSESKSRLSAMMDDAAADRECEHCVRHLKTDPNLRATSDLSSYGDTLRGDTAAAIADRVRDRLAAEPVVFAARGRSSKEPGKLGRAFSSRERCGGGIRRMDGAAALRRTARSASAPIAQSVEVLPVAVPAPEGVTDYLLAHQRFSPGPSIGGIAPYVRSVADEPRPR